MDVKTNILTGAGHLFLKHGLKSVSMDDIARALAISKKTIYKFFKNKDQLAVSHLKHFIETQINEIIHIESKSKDPIHNLILLTEYMKNTVCIICPAMIHDLQKYHPKAWKLYMNFKHTFLLQFICNALKEGMRMGYFRKDLNPRIIARTRLEQVEMGFNTEIFPPHEFDSAEVQLQLFEHYIHGICTLKGHKLLNKYREIIEDD
jgi:AcrR family transcriptional regulator